MGNCSEIGFVLRNTNQSATKLLAKFEAAHQASAACKPQTCFSCARISVQPLLILIISRDFKISQGAKLFSKLLFFSVVFSAAGVTSSTALDVSSGPPDDEIINRTLQCEAGRVGRIMKAQGLPQNLQVGISWKSTKTTNSGGGIGATFAIFNWGIQGDISKEDVDELNSDALQYNLFPDNRVVCTGYNISIVKEGVGLYDCLVNKKLASLRQAVLGGGGTTGCKQQVTLTRKISGNLKVNIWGVNLGPSASWGDSYVYVFTIGAPVRKK